MSPRSYGYLWIVFAVSAGLLWLFGAMSMVVVVACGFVAFGFIFAGMMCVLPGVVAHPPQNEDRLEQSTTGASKEAATDADPSMAAVHFPLNLKFR